ncbi:MAG: energy-coupling factor transporter ATPase [Bacilli bacterium]|nr:energy-coupling factor transporter ATPase [Bacilli bacterium]
MQINFKNVTFFYNEKTFFKQCVLKNINLDLTKEDFIAVIGKNGSGKSTIIDLISCFLKPTEGCVIIDDFVNDKKKSDKKKLYNLRKKIGVLFQFSENQLFKDTVIDDVMFGVKNFYPEKNARQEAERTLALVGLDSSFYNRYPFELSSGEKRRVAIAGILAYNPKLLILDEITVGLDVHSKKTLMKLLKNIQKTQKIKIILVTHDMDIVLKYANKVVLLDNGKIIKIGCPDEVLSNVAIEQFGMKIPNIIKFTNLLKINGFDKTKKHFFTINEVINSLKNE